MEPNRKFQGFTLPENLSVALGRQINMSQRSWGTGTFFLLWKPLCHTSGIEIGLCLLRVRTDIILRKQPLKNGQLMLYFVINPSL